jgi:hypothetical protein
MHHPEDGKCQSITILFLETGSFSFFCVSRCRVRCCAAAGCWHLLKSHSSPRDSLVDRPPRHRCKAHLRLCVCRSVVAGSWRRRPPRFGTGWRRRKTRASSGAKRSARSLRQKGWRGSPRSAMGTSARPRHWHVPSPHPCEIQSCVAITHSRIRERLCCFAPQSKYAVRRVNWRLHGGVWCVQAVGSSYKDPDYALKHPRGGPQFHSLGSGRAHASPDGALSPAPSIHVGDECVATVRHHHTLSMSSDGLPCWSRPKTAGVVICDE